MENLLRLNATADRQAAFERVYDEGRWKLGADGAECKSGWSAVDRGQGTEALRALAEVVETHNVGSYIDIPVGDGCFSSAALERLRARRPNLTYQGLEIVESLVEHNLVKRDNLTRLMHADVASLEQLPRADLIFSRQMMQHQCDRDAMHVLDLISRSGARLALLTHFETNHANSDIGCASGGYRPQNLRFRPFNLPPPLAFWPEKYPVDPRVGLGLWKLPLPPRPSPAPAPSVGSELDAPHGDEGSGEVQTSGHILNFGRLPIPFW